MFLRPATPRHLHLLPEVRHPRRLPTLLAMAAASGLAQFPTAAIAVALPTLHAELDVSLSELQWTITGFTLAMSAFLIAFGRLSDTFGRRLILAGGLVLFAAGSILAALATGALLLIAGTAIAGLGAAALIPSSLAIVVNAYPPEKRGLPIGLWGAASALAQALGPLAGGALTGELGWESLFWAQAIVAGGILAVVLASTAESRDPEATPGVDGAGLGLAAAALLTLSLGVIQAPAWGITAPQTLVLLGASVVLATAFALVERRVPSPLVNFGFFRARNYAGANAVLFVLNFAFIVSLFFLPLQLQELLGSSPTESGVQLLPLMVVLVVLLPLGGPVAERVGPLPPIAAGLSALAAGLLLLAGTEPSDDYRSLWLPMALCGASGLALTPMNLAAMNAIPTRQSGAAGGIFTTLSGVGISLGVAITGAVFNASQLASTKSIAADRGITVTADQAEALDGLLADAPGAKAALDSFGKGDQSALESVVREAFADALDDAYRLGALVALAGLVLAVALIRRRPPADSLELG